MSPADLEDPIDVDDAADTSDLPDSAEQDDGGESDDLGDPDDDEAPPGWIGRTLDTIGPPELVLIAACGLWTVVFIRLPKLRYDRYGTFGFDLGIYDQGTWLLSQFKDPFVSIRGLELFGHHANIFLVFLAPFYRLGAGPIFLLVVQVLAQASGGIALYLLGRDLLKSRWAGTGIAIAFYLNPTNQWLTWEFFHPDAVVIGPLLFAYWAARAKRWPIFWFAFVLALLCKEDAALSLAILGIFLMFWGERRRGIITAAVSAGWFLFATRALIPFENGVGPFYDAFFGTLGNTPTEVIYNSVRHPSQSWRLISAPDAKSWYWRMWAPWAFVPLLDIRALMFAGPMIFVDMMSSFPYTRNYQLHYSTLILVASAVATVEAIAWISRGAKDHITTRNTMVVVVMVAALLSTISWGASPIARGYRSGIWPLQPDSRSAAKAQAIRDLPSQASVSTAYNLDTHLTHRPKVYEFPVPWCNINWGVDGENLHNPDEVEWLLMDRQILHDERDVALFDDLLSHEFEIRSERDDIVLAQRVAPPTTPSRGNPRPGQCFDRAAIERFKQ